MKKLIIVGAGASGVYLSILVKQQLGEKMDVVVLEQNATPLKKLLATGNGRCNLSNRDMQVNYYQSDNQDYVETIISSFDMQKRMMDLGLFSIYQGQLLYPKSEQALTVKNILMDEAQSLGVHFIYEQEVTGLQKEGQYRLWTSQQSYMADYVVFAMGSEAGKLSGVNSSRYDILKQMKLNVIPGIPSLTQFYTQPVLKKLKGVRAKGTFSLLENNQCLHQEKGEILFTDYGVSGIAIMQLSSFYKENHQYELAIDFFDNEDEKKLLEYIEVRQHKGYNQFYAGLVHSKIASYFDELNINDPSQIVKLLKDFRLSVQGIRSSESSQVMKGGLSLQEVDQNLQIKKYPQVYAIGEILNVTGMCGGYNIHFAMASAKQVADAIVKDI